MTTSEGSSKNSKKRDKLWHQRLLPIGAVFGGLAGMAVLYIGYDLIKTRMSPCESIFRQTAVSLSTKLKFLKAEGELAIGHDKMAELSERAQMTALNLKTCCTVLDAGRLNPEQFITCKSKARSYESRVDEIVTLVSPAKASAKPISKTGNSVSVATPSSPKIETKVAAAIDASKSLNQHVTKVRKDQVLETLEAMTPEHIDVAAKEQEPNDNLLQSNRVRNDKWVTGAIGASGDADVYSFKAPEIHRDWVTVELQNRSTGFKPNIVFYDAEKTGFATAYKTTAGADIKYSFVAKPGATYFARLTSYYGKSTGVYLFRVKPAKSYDTFEPNDRILDAKPVSRGTTIDASVMDGGDFDHYVISPSESEQHVNVRIENTSGTLHPSLVIYDGRKNSIKSAYSTTPGADVETTFKMPAQNKAYIRVHDYYTKASGSYRLTVDAKQK